LDRRLLACYRRRYDGPREYCIWELKSGTLLEDFGDYSNFDPMRLGDFERGQLPNAPIKRRKESESKDGTRGIVEDGHGKVIRDPQNGTVLFRMQAEFQYRNEYNWDVMSAAGDYAAIADFRDNTIWHRRRPEYWWGVAWLPEFWLTALFAGALGWSVWRDRKMGARKAGEAA